ncbi:MAG: hypothetical protein IJ471_03765, partial [Eubacterium sp.]|nr:hypothetical protein [Eubacterium sp.]
EKRRSKKSMLKERKARKNIQVEKRRSKKSMLKERKAKISIPRWKLALVLSSWSVKMIELACSKS